jgi:hypothetical protein
VLIGTTASPKSRVEFNGEALSTRRLAFASPASDIDFSVFENSSPVVLLVTPELLRRHLGQEATAEMLGSGHTLDCDPGFNQRLIRSANLIIDRYLDHGELLENKRERDMIESELLEGFAQILSGGDAIRAQYKAQKKQGIAPRDRVCELRKRADTDTGVFRSRWCQPASAGKRFQGNNGHHADEVSAVVPHEPFAF